MDKKPDHNWQTEGFNELYSSEWFGAIIRYFWHLGRKPFNTFYTPKQLKKNALAGWVFKVLVVIIGLTLLILNSIS